MLRKLQTGSVIPSEKTDRDQPLKSGFMYQLKIITHKSQILSDSYSNLKSKIYNQQPATVL